MSGSVASEAGGATPHMFRRTAGEKWVFRRRRRGATFFRGGRRKQPAAPARTSSTQQRTADVLPLKVGPQGTQVGRAALHLRIGGCGGSSLSFSLSAA